MACKLWLDRMGGRRAPEARWTLRKPINPAPTRPIGRVNSPPRRIAPKTNWPGESPPLTLLPPRSGARGGVVGAGSEAPPGSTPSGPPEGQIRVREAPVEPVPELDPEDPFGGIAVEAPGRPIRFPETLPIYVDSREPDVFLRILQARGIPAQVVTLEDEDFLIGDVHVTRKSTPDLFASLESGHFHDEIARLLLHAHKIHAVVEDSIQLRPKYVPLLQPTIDSFDEKIPVKHTTGPEDTVDFLIRIRKRIIEGRYAASRRRPVIYGQSSPVITTFATFPGIGPELAERMAEVWPSIDALDRDIRETHEFRKGKEDEMELLADGVVRVVRRRWPSKKAWRESKWNSKVAGIGEPTAEIVEAYVLDGVVVPR